MRLPVSLVRFPSPRAHPRHLLSFPSCLLFRFLLRTTGRADFKVRPYHRKPAVLIGLGLVLIRPDSAQRRREIQTWICSTAFSPTWRSASGPSRLDIRMGYQLTFEICSTATLHYCLAGRGTLKIRNGAAIMLRQHSFALLPPRIIYSIGANENEASLTFPRRRLRAPLFKESVPTIHAGDGGPGILTACGEVGFAVTSTPDLFASLDKPIVEHFDGRDGLRDQFVILLAESARPGLGTRALTEALLKQCLILLLRRQIDRGTAPIPWMSAMAEPGLARALQAMLERPSERFTVEALASIAGMSRSAFAARFTQTFGRTPLNL